MKRALIFAIVAGILTGGTVYWLNSGTKKQSNTQTQTNPMDELKIEDLTVGTGAEAKAGDTVTVNYVGTLDNGTKFDSSYDRGEPATFSLNQVIKGWQEGIPGMKVGGKRRLIIPASLGYGANAVGSIPPNSTLHFDVELLKVGQ